MRAGRTIGAGLAILAIAFAGCGGGSTSPQTTADGWTPYAPLIGLPGPPSAGRTLVAESGCLACHRIDSLGYDGPGPALTHIAARLNTREIAQALRTPTSPMPSFGRLAPAKFSALVAYLSQLR